MKISLTKFFKEVRGHSSNAPDMMSALTRWGIPFDAVPAEVEEHAKGKGRGGVQHGDIVDIKYLPAAKRAYRAEKAAKDALAAARAVEKHQQEQKDRQETLAKMEPPYLTNDKVEVLIAKIDALNAKIDEKIDAVHAAVFAECAAIRRLWD